MDIQIKRGIIELLVLALLKDNDYYGYSLMKDVLEFLEVSDFALYPILKRLETENDVSTYSMEANGRLRKYYRITSKGLEKLRNAKEDWESLKKIYSKILGDDYND